MKLNLPTIPEPTDSKYSIGKNPNSLKNLKKMTAKRAKELGFGKWMKGKKLSIETRRRISQSTRGGNKTSFKKGINVSVKTQFKKGLIPWNKGIGNKTPEAIRIRMSKEYKLWRTSVFERDDYTCIWCYQKGGALNADHIKPFSLFPELRFDLNNGRTLCVDCHRETDTFARKVVNYANI